MKCLNCGSEDLMKKEILIEGDANESSIGYKIDHGAYTLFVPINSHVCKSCGFLMFFDSLDRKHLNYELK